MTCNYYRIVSQLLTEVHKEIPCLNSLVTSIGNLDMITSFAMISRHPDYGRSLFRMEANSNIFHAGITLINCM